MTNTAVPVQPQHLRLARVLAIASVAVLCIGEIFNHSPLSETILFLRVIHYGLIAITTIFAYRTSKIASQSEFDIWALLITTLSNTWILGSGWDTGFAIEMTIGLFLIIYISYYFISSIKIAGYYSALMATFVTVAILSSTELSMSPTLLLAMMYFYLLTGFVSMRKRLNDRQRLEMNEESLRNSRDRAEEAVRMRNEFMTNMSHELRTPLNGIIGMTGLLESTSLQTQQKEMVDTIGMSSQLLLNLISGILDYAKLEASGITLTVKENDIEFCGAQCVDLLMPLALRKGIGLYLDVDPNTIKTLVFDSTKVAQVLVNLLNNALKFTDEGEVRLEIMTETISGQSPLLVCRVIDSGVGIPEQQKKSIFEEFSQGDLSITRRFGGTGLGLTICRRLLDAMGGSIDVESTEGVGSVFTARIPIKVASANPSEKVVLGQRELQGQNAVLLTSENTRRHILEKNLLHWGVGVHCVTNADLALQTIHSIGLKDELPKFIICELEPSNSSLSHLKKGLATIYADKSYTLIILSLRHNSDYQVDADSVFVNSIKASALKLAMTNALQKVGADQRTESDIENTELTQASESTLKILVVEDNPINQKVAFAILKKLGYAPDLAVNGLEALEKTSSEQYDVILMDIQMPEMDGLTATIKIRERSGPQPTIIAMTANAFDQDREKCIDAGMENFIAKPIDMEALRVSLKSIENTSAE